MTGAADTIIQTDEPSYAVTDLRELERCVIEYDSIIVFDLETAERFGRVLNMTTGGFLLKSDTPLTLNKVYRLSMSIPGVVNQKSVIRCLAKSLWGDEVKGLWENKTNIPDYYWTGFEFVALDESDSKTIALLIDRLNTKLKSE